MQKSADTHWEDKHEDTHENAYAHEIELRIFDEKIPAKNIPKMGGRSLSQTGLSNLKLWH